MELLPSEESITARSLFVNANPQFFEENIVSPIQTGVP